MRGIVTTGGCGAALALETREGAHVIVGNLIADGAADGIALFSAGNRVARNTLLGHGDQGLFVGSLATLTRNRVLLDRVDLTDATPACDDNVWQDNELETSESEGCVD